MVLHECVFKLSACFYATTNLVLNGKNDLS